MKVEPAVSCGGEKPVGANDKQTTKEIIRTFTIKEGNVSKTTPFHITSDKGSEALEYRTTAARRLSLCNKLTKKEHGWHACMAHGKNASCCQTSS